MSVASENPEIQEKNAASQPASQPHKSNGGNSDDDGGDGGGGVAAGVEMRNMKTK